MTDTTEIMWARTYISTAGNERAMEGAEAGVAAALKVCAARKWPITKEPYYAIVSFGVVSAYFEFRRAACIA